MLSMHDELNVVNRWDWLIVTQMKQQSAIIVWRPNTKWFNYCDRYSTIFYQVAIDGEKEDGYHFATDAKKAFLERQKQADEADKNKARPNIVSVLWASPLHS